MANIDDPRGFRPYQWEGKTYRSREYTKTAAQTIYEGDLLKRVAAGTVQVHVNGDTDPIVGVAAHYSPAADTVMDVIDDPEVTYVAQCSGTFAAADAGSNADVAAAPSPDTDLNRSGQEVDGTFATTATLPLKVFGLAPQINDEPNDAGAANADLLVKINQSERTAGVAGI